MTSADPRPEAVFVYGLNDWTEPYVALIESLGTSITAYVDSEQAGSNFRGAKVLDPAAFVERYGAQGAEPVVILSRSADGLQPNFEAGVTLLANELGCRRRLLHPAFLKRYISPPFPFGHALFGYPSSGNTLLGSLLEEFLGRRLAAEKPEFDIAIQLMRAACTEHMTMLSDTVFRAARGLGAWAVQGRLIRTGSFDLALSAGPRQAREAERGLPSPKFMYLSGLGGFPHVMGQSYASHELVDEALMVEMKALNLEVFVACRQPLDIIVSLAAKHWRPPDAVLHDMAWFGRVAENLKAWYEAALQRSGQLTMVRYEELLERPLEIIPRLAEAAGYELEGEAEAKWLAEAYIGRTLQAPGSSAALFESGHLWQPGAGKWRERLSAGHVGILEDLDYGRFLEDLGYDSDFAGPLKGREPPAAPLAMDAAWLAWHDYTTHRSQGYPVTFHHEDEIFVEFGEAPQGPQGPQGPTTLYTNDAEAAELLPRLLDSDFSRVLFDAI